tara:strand:+ start:252 stop:1016 length:765 start_codon:yes stop_codon:yes gene_type:complete
MKKQLINKFRSKLKNGKYTIGGWMQICDSNIAEIMADGDYEWITFDLEHGSFSIKELTNLVRSIELKQKIKLARLPNKNLEICAQVLDAGCDGIIVPNVKSRNELIKIKNLSYFPPEGKRGVGFSRSNLFGKNFKKNMNSKIKPILIAMIESKDGIKNLSQILTVKGLDAVLIGPYDLSSSLGITGKFQHSKFKSALNQIKKLSKKNKIPLGIHVLKNSLSEVKKYVSKGFKFIPFGTDAILLTNAIENSFRKK